MDTYEKIANVEETFMTVFKDAMHVETSVVKVGGTSSNVYVPKRFAGHPVTVIIWDKPEENCDGREQQQADNARAELQTGDKKEL